MLSDNERDRLEQLARPLALLHPPAGSCRSIPWSNWGLRRGFDLLRHTNGRLAINITADIDPQGHDRAGHQKGRCIGISCRKSADTMT